MAWVVFFYALLLSPDLVHPPCNGFRRNVAWEDRRQTSLFGDVMWLADKLQYSDSPRKTTIRVVSRDGIGMEIDVCLRVTALFVARKQWRVNIITPSKNFPPENDDTTPNGSSTPAGVRVAISESNDNVSIRKSNNRATSKSGQDMQKQSKTATVCNFAEFPYSSSY